ncbi:unnamed protein product, partial [Phaeothamnion confervicola]
ELKPFFRALTAMLGLQDGLAGWRVNQGMSKLMIAMEDQSRFLRATEVGVEMVLRLAKAPAAGPAVRRWLRDHAETAAWIPPWLQARQARAG